MRQLAAVLRSAVFLLIQALVTPPYAFLILATFPLPPLARYRVIRLWSVFMVWTAQIVCGIRWELAGRENIPTEPCIIMAKHQSAWETMAFQLILPPHVYVIKKQLLRIPFFGWGLALMSPIAIDRDAGPRSLKQTLEQGRARLRQGFSVVIFPEGTRVAPGAKRRYRVGGAWLACKTGARVLPIAHNAGELWGKNALVKYPGVVRMVIGTPIDSRGLDPGDLNQQVEAWIEGQMSHIASPLAEAA